MAILSSPPTLYQATEALRINISAPKPSPKYPAKTHARNTARRLPSNHGLVYLEGGVSRNYEYSDMGPVFRQRRYFLYLSGVVDIPDCKLTYCLETDILTLYIPPLDPATVLWSGMPMSREDCLKKFDVDAVSLTTYLADDLLAYTTANPKSSLYILPLAAPSINATAKPSLNTTALKPAIDYSRLRKTPYEIACIRKANAVSAAAHAAVMAAASTAKNEAELEAIFVGTCISRFAKSQAYAPIVGSGTNAATLHYVHNDQPLKGRQLLLVDAGAEWEGYASDVTRTYPISGTFTAEARSIYKLVERMQEECTAMVVRGQRWGDIHLHAHRVAVRGLLELGILKGDEDEIFDAGTTKAFFPHGLGHHLGLECHDVGTWDDLDKLEGAAVSVKLPPPEMGVYASIDTTIPMSGAVCRTLGANMVLDEDMVLTVEPGIYFCEWIIKPFLTHPVHGKFIDRKVLDRYWDVGGVRIEDDILVLGRGNENLTTAPKGRKARDIVRGRQ